MKSCDSTDPEVIIPIPRKTTSGTEKTIVVVACRCVNLDRLNDKDRRGQKPFCSTHTFSQLFSQIPT